MEQTQGRLPNTVPGDAAQLVDVDIDFDLVLELEGGPAPNTPAAEQQAARLRPNKLGGAEQNQLVTANMDLVGYIVAEVACRYPRHVDRDELWSAGALGLVEASRRFDPDCGIPFARYAVIRIRGAIIDSTRTRDWAPRSRRRHLREVQQMTAMIEEQTMVPPSTPELAAALGITSEELAKCRATETMGSLLHLDQVGAGQEPLALQVAEDRIEALPEDALERREMRGTLATALFHLPEVQAQVVTRHYLQGERLQDIAVDMGITEARVSQIRAEALAALRSLFASLFEGLEPTPDSAPGKRARAAYVGRLAAQSTWRSRLDSAACLDLEKLAFVAS